MVDVGDKAGLLGLPTEQRLGSLARGRAVDGREPGEPAEMRSRLFRRLWDCRNVQSPANHLGDLFERHAFISDRVERARVRAALKGEPKNPGRIEPMYAWPAVLTVPEIGGDALLAGKTDDPRDEAVIAMAVHRRRQPHGGHAHAASLERRGCGFRVARKRLGGKAG